VLPKKSRLVDTESIKLTYKTRYRVYTDLVKVLLSKRRGSNFKLLIVVPKKIFKKMHDRTCVKRKVSAIFEDLYKNDKLPEDFGCIVHITNSDILHKKQSEVSADILPGLIKALKMSQKKKVDKK